MMKKILTNLFIWLLPNFFAVFFLNVIGHRIHRSAYIGFSLITCDCLYMDADSWIGHLNFLNVRKILLRKRAFIKHMNRFRGPMNILMQEEASFSNKNKAYRANAPVTYGIAHIKLGVVGQIVSKHHLDVTRSIEIGDYSTIGGFDTQFWTHGFYHADRGIERVRIDGEIKIGNNVYVGTRSTFNPGVKIGDHIHIGASTCVAKSLELPGMYVSEGLRYIVNDIESVRNKLNKVENYSAAEVYEKQLA